MAVLKLLIADNSADFVTDLCVLLKDVFEITICQNGYDAISLIHENPPDILLLDLLLPGCDGITVLKAVCAMEQRPIVLVASRLFGFFVQDSMDRLGICYAIQKPCDVVVASNRLKELAQYPKEKLLPIPDEGEIIAGMLSALGISNKAMGYRYLTEAIRLIAENPNQQYTKELYPSVGALVSSNWRQVERDIRTVIETAWEGKNAVVWQDFFAQQSVLEKKPSNSTVISTLGQLLSKRLSERKRSGN